MISYTPEVCTVLAENILWYYKGEDWNTKEEGEEEEEEEEEEKDGKEEEEEENL